MLTNDRLTCGDLERKLPAESASFAALWTWGSMRAGDPGQCAKVGTPLAHKSSCQGPKIAVKTSWSADPPWGLSLPRIVGLQPGMPP